jgi:AraC-like DNA-binding protein
MPIDINGVKSFIRKHISEIKTVSELAVKLNLHVETLRKNFLREEKIPLSSFILSERVKAMKRLLEESHLKCFEICEKLGVREDSGGVLFKRSVGMSMEAYRKLIVPYRGQSKLLKTNPTTQLRKKTPKHRHKSSSNVHKNGNGRLFYGTNGHTLV